MTRWSTKDLTAQLIKAQAAPSFFQSSFLPAQALSAVGAAREQIALQPLQEQIARFNFGQITPRQSLQTFLSSVYGSPMASSNIPMPQAQTNPLAQGLGLGTLGYLGGSFLGGTPLNQPGQAAILGGLLGGLGGYFG